MHLMIDLETLGHRTSAIVTQLGWCVFDMHSSLILSADAYYFAPEPQEQLRRTIDASTFLWWLKQSEVARNRMADVGATTPLYQHLNDWQASIDWQNIEGVWSHGVSFDIPILKDLMHQCHIEPAWLFRIERDTRTLYALRPNIKFEKAKFAHSAKEDAVAQAAHCQKVWKALQFNVGPATDEELLP